MSFITRSLPIIGVSAIMGYAAACHAWPAVIFAAPLALHMAVRQALFEEMLIEKESALHPVPEKPNAKG